MGYRFSLHLLAVFLLAFSLPTDAPAAQKTKKKQSQKRVVKRRTEKPKINASVVRPQTAPKPVTTSPTAYSGSPVSFSHSIPSPRVTPLVPPSKSSERRIQLDMTRPYGEVSPTPTPGAERSIASESARLR